MLARSRRLSQAKARRMLAAFALVCALAVALLALGCKGKKADRVRRTSSEDPVEVVSGGGERPRRQRSDVAEREPNDEAAQEVTLGSFVRGRLESLSDVDRYRVAIKSAGPMTAIVSGVPAVDLVVELRDTARGDAVLAKSDRGGAAIDEGIAGFFVEPGAYDVVVRAFVKPPGKGASKVPAAAPPVTFDPYELEIATSEPVEGGETEPNFDGGTATALTIGEPAAGRIGWAGDVDVWKVETEALAAKDALDFAVTAVDGLALQLELRDGLGRPIAKRKGGKGQALAVRGWSPKDEESSSAPPFLYVAVFSDRSQPGVGYQLSATARAAEADEEREGNDRPELAQPLAEAGAVVRAVLEAGDTDCFAIAAAAGPRRLEISVDLADPGAGSTGAATNVAAEVLVGDKVVASSDEPAGRSERILVEVAAGKAAVVRVRGAAKPGDPGAYNVSWMEAATDAMPPEEPSGSASAPK